MVLHYWSSQWKSKHSDTILPKVLMNVNWKCFNAEQLAILAFIRVLFKPHLSCCMFFGFNLWDPPMSTRSLNSFVYAGTMACSNYGVRDNFEHAVRKMEPGT